jgi:hypothetical protein
LQLEHFDQACCGLGEEEQRGMIVAGRDGVEALLDHLFAFVGLHLLRLARLACARVSFPFAVAAIVHGSLNRANQRFISATCALLLIHPQSSGHVAAIEMKHCVNSRVTPRA